MRIEFMGMTTGRVKLPRIVWTCDCGVENFATGRFSRRLVCRECCRAFDVEVTPLPETQLEEGPAAQMDEERLDAVSELPEQRKADALKVLAAEGASRTEMLRALDGWTERVRKATLAALAAGVSVRRAAEVGGISPDTVMRWSNADKAAQKSTEGERNG